MAFGSVLFSKRNFAYFFAQPFQHISTVHFFDFLLEYRSGFEPEPQGFAGPHLKPFDYRHVFLVMFSASTTFVDYHNPDKNKQLND